MKNSKLLSLAVLIAAFAAPILPQILHAAELKPETLQAWDAYLQEVTVRVEQRAVNVRPFLWTDESPDRQARVRRGEVVVAPVIQHGTRNVPNGLIHDWIGAVFIPNATIEDLSAVVHDYDNYKQMYRPVVTASRSLTCTEGDQEFLMVWQHKVLFVNAAMQGHYESHDVTLNSSKGYNVAESTELRQIEKYGHSDEHLLPPDTGSGFIWRMHSIARYEERDGGVYLEVEAIALTRDIPGSLSWLVTPTVNHLSINSLTTTLRQTRDAVVSPGREARGPVSCPNPTHAAQLASAGGQE
jgi:hypothetical protein